MVSKVVMVVKVVKVSMVAKVVMVVTVEMVELIRHIPSKFLLPSRGDNIPVTSCGNFQELSGRSNLRQVVAIVRKIQAIVRNCQEDPSGVARSLIGEKTGAGEKCDKICCSFLLNP